MRADPAEPIGGVSGIGFLAMQDGMPEASFRRMKVLRDEMAFLKTGKIEPQPCERTLGGIGIGKKLRGACCYPTAGLDGRAFIRDQGDQPLSIAVESQQIGNLWTVSFWIE